LVKLVIVQNFSSFLAPIDVANFILFRKIAKSYYLHLHACVSVRLSNRRPSLNILTKCFRKCVEKMIFPSKFHKNNRFCKGRSMCVCDSTSLNYFNNEI